MNLRTLSAVCLVALMGADLWAWQRSPSQSSGKSDEHVCDYTKDDYTTSKCCLYNEEYDCVDNDDMRICKKRCGSWGKEMKYRKKCKCERLGPVITETGCKNNL